MADFVDKNFVFYVENVSKILLRCNMKKWQQNEVVELFKEVENCKTNKKDLKIAFENYAKKSGRNISQIRNFYYFEAKKLKKDKKMCNSLKINHQKLKINSFLKFSKNEEKLLFDKISKEKQNGISAREACFRMAGGNVTIMTRLQNKYQNLLKKQKEKMKISEMNLSENKSEKNLKNINHKIEKFINVNESELNKNKNINKIEFEKVDQTKFPNISDNKEKVLHECDQKNANIIQFQSLARLSDADINNLFMGLVRLIKNNVTDEKLEKSEQENILFAQKLRLCQEELRQKNFYIENLKQKFNELKKENQKLVMMFESNSQKFKRKFLKDKFNEIENKNG